MKQFKLVIFLIFNLLLSPSLAFSFKLPTPSQNVLIVNHLNYLRYDYLSDPTSRVNRYQSPYSQLRQLSNNHLNNTGDYDTIDSYSLDRTTNNFDLILNGHLDEELSNHLDQFQSTVDRQNDEDLNNNLNDYQIEFNSANEQNNSLLDNQLNSALNNLLNSDQSEDGQQNRSSSDELIDNQQANISNDQEANNQSIQQNEQLNENLTEQINDNQLDESNLDDKLDQLNLANDQNDVETNLSDLIITNSTEGQQRLLQLNLLQQTEPSLSLVLDVDSPFLQNVQDSDVSPKLKETSNDQLINDLRPSTNLTFNAYFSSEQLNNIYIEDNLDDLLNSPSFNLIDFTRSDDEQNLNSTLDSDILLPANIDDLAYDLISQNNATFLNDDNALENLDSDDNLQSLIGGNDISSILNQDASIIDSKLNNSTEEATYSSSTAINRINPDSYIHELLSDEDLQMIGFPNLQQPNLENLAEASGVNDLNNDDLDLTNEDRIEVSSDSAISSMSRSDWFDSGSDSSSHFDDQLGVEKKRNLKNNKDQQLQTRYANGSLNNDDALFDEFDLVDSSYDLYSRDNVFDAQILDLNDVVPRLDPIRLDPISFYVEPQSVPLDNSLPSVTHNHTYAGAIETFDSDRASTSSSSIGQTYIKNSSSTKQTTRTTNRATTQTDTLEAIRNRRLIDDDSTGQSNFDLISLTSETSTFGENERNLSRDEKKAKELKIPLSVCEIIDMPIDEFNECLTKYELNEAQLTLIKDIRRRGKNKVAAQNCRKRKINQIEGLKDEVDYLKAQKSDLLSYYDKLFSIKQLAENKYQKLYEFIAERSQTNAALLANFELNFRMANNVKRNNSEENNGAVGGTQFEENNNTNQLNEMSSTGDLMMLNLTMDIKPKVANYKKALAMN